MDKINNIIQIVENVNVLQELQKFEINVLYVLLNKDMMFEQNNVFARKINLKLALENVLDAQMASIMKMELVDVLKTILGQIMAAVENVLVIKEIDLSVP